MSEKKSAAVPSAPCNIEGNFPGVTESKCVISTTTLASGEVLVQELETGGAITLAANDEMAIRFFQELRETQSKVFDKSRKRVGEKGKRPNK